MGGLIELDTQTRGRALADLGVICGGESRARSVHVRLGVHLVLMILLTLQLLGLVLVSLLLLLLVLWRLLMMLLLTDIRIRPVNGLLLLLLMRTTSRVTRVTILVMSCTAL